MSLVQELVSEKYNIPFPRETDSFDSLGANDFLFALEVPSDTGSKISTSSPCEEVKSDERPTSCLYRSYYHEMMDEWFKDEYDSILFLSLKDIDNVRKKWRKIKNDPTTFGTLLMITLLNDAPNTAAKMPAKPGVLHNGVMVYDSDTIESGKQKAELLNKIIKHIDVPEHVTHVTHESGIEISFNKPRLKKEDFNALHSAIIKTVTTHYKMDNTPEIIASLKKTFWVILGLIEDSNHWNDFGSR
ncbi:uncharacterized protein [Halyomorpha halys]|uniref:uncharacterized protein n=1 Tax=Halyomorpha halys TaxID=286706 RepID=UPI0006D5055B|nr:uncharacterized protein LOC106680211 [Halyomorpha halys]